MGMTPRLYYWTNKTTQIAKSSLQETHTLSASASYPTNINENSKDGGILLLRIWDLHVVCTHVHYVCMYVCMYACMIALCTCICTYVRVYACMNVYVCVYVHTYVCIMYIHTCVCAYVCTYIHVCVCVCVCTYVCICMYVYMCVCVYVCMYFSTEIIMGAWDRMYVWWCKKFFNTNLWDAPFKVI